VTQEPTPTLTGVARQTTAREFIAVLFRRRRLVLGLFLVTTATVLVMTLSTKTLYESEGRVLIRRGEKESVFDAGRQIFNQWDEELASEMEIILSQPVITRAHELLAAGPFPTTPFNASQVTREVRGKSNVVSISYFDRDPEVAQRCAQAVIDAYIEYREHHMMLGDPRAFFNTEIAAADQELRSLLEQRRKYAMEAGIQDMNQQKSSALQLLQSLTQRRSDVAGELAKIQYQERAMRKLQGRPEIDNPTSAAFEVAQDPIVEIKHRILEQQGRLAGLREQYRDDAVEVANAESTLAMFQGMLRREVEARLEVSQTRVAALTEQMHSIDRDIAMSRAALETMPDKEARIVDLDFQIATLKTRYQDLLQKSGAAKITEYTSMPLDVILLLPAGPARQSSSRDYVRLALAPAFSVVVGIAVAFFVDGLDITVRTAGHAEEVSDIPVLATVNENRRRRRAG
jgi:uncharacterized protein involved in exopolysaccharide biosynthesis